MKTICVSDKKGNLLFTINAYDKKMYNQLFKILKKKNKNMNVYERN